MALSVPSRTHFKDEDNYYCCMIYHDKNVNRHKLSSCFHSSISRNTQRGRMWASHGSVSRHGEKTWRYFEWWGGRDRFPCWLLSWGCGRMSLSWELHRLREWRQRGAEDGREGNIHPHVRPPAHKRLRARANATAHGGRQAGRHVAHVRARRAAQACTHPQVH